MTDSPPDNDDNAADEPQGPSPAEEFAASVAALVGSAEWTADHGTIRVIVGREGWRSAAETVADKAGLPFFSWLSAVDWAKEVSVGEPVEDVDELDERFEVICRLSSVSDSRSVHLIAEVPKEDPVIESLVPVFGGAAWHEREAAEMYGIRFDGHPHLVHIYLPDGFEGNPLRKDYALLSREVKPWPGTVDVEDMPSTENVEAGDA